MYMYQRKHIIYTCIYYDQCKASKPICVRPRPTLAPQAPMWASTPPPPPARLLGGRPYREAIQHPSFN